MANNYTLFSVSLGKCSNEECEWLKTEYAYKHEETLVDSFHINIDAGDVTIYSDECGDCEAAANLIQAFLKKFRPKQWVILETAFTCSKARPGEFGGAVVLVTAKKQHWMNTSQWATSQAKQLRLSTKERL